VRIFYPTQTKDQVSSYGYNYGMFRVFRCTSPFFGPGTNSAQLVVVSKNEPLRVTSARPRKEGGVGAHVKELEQIRMHTSS